MTEQERAEFEAWWKAESDWYREPDLSCSEKLLAESAWFAARRNTVSRDKVEALCEAVGLFMFIAHAFCNYEDSGEHGDLYTKRFHEADELVCQLRDEIKEGGDE